LKFNRTNNEYPINHPPKTHLTDSFNRCIDYLRISIPINATQTRILRIFKGLKNFKNDEIMTNEEIVRFVRIAHKYGLKKVRSPGEVSEEVMDLISSIKKSA
jgi:molybdenum cofactor biosynthesis enzyme MoaA